MPSRKLEFRPQDRVCRWSPRSLRYADPTKQGLTAGLMVALFVGAGMSLAPEARPFGIGVVALAAGALVFLARGHDREISRLRTFTERADDSNVGLVRLTLSYRGFTYGGDVGDLHIDDDFVHFRGTKCAFSLGRGTFAVGKGRSPLDIRILRYYTLVVAPAGTGLTPHFAPSIHDRIAAIATADPIADESSLLPPLAPIDFRKFAIDVMTLAAILAIMAGAAIGVMFGTLLWPFAVAFGLGGAFVGYRVARGILWDRSAIEVDP